MSKILVVEDDFDFAEQVQQWLEHEKSVVDLIHNRDEANDRLKFYEYDLIVLDAGLPDMSGTDVLKSYRERGGKAPVLILTGKNTVEEKERGLDSGADDYLTKPFHMKELSVRLRALLRRAGTASPTMLTAGDLTVDPAEQLLSRGFCRSQIKPWFGLVWN